jgi:DMSO/TMAO reductase YedYZ molybdopterin-dependent catalytic subunit
VLGEHGPAVLHRRIGNARWGGTPLAPVLRQAGLSRDATEVIFWGADRGPTTIRDNPGVLPLPAGSTGTTEPDATGGLDLTITERFARSMSVEEALGEDNLLCYEMNGEPLPREHGFPLRLIAPGWYGIANVKWLTRIEVVDQRFAGRFMAREYVTIREQQVDGETVWTFLTGGPRPPEVGAREGDAPRQPLRRHGRGVGRRGRPGRGPGRRRPVAGGAPARGPPRPPARRVRLGLLDPAARAARAG